MRLYVAYFLDPPEFTKEALQKAEAARRKYADDWIAGGAVKTMLDGVVEAHTAAMLAPYSDDPSLSGELFLGIPTNTSRPSRNWTGAGFRSSPTPSVIARCGWALDAYGEAAARNHTQDARPRVEHIETIAAADIPRFGSLGAIASFQPLHTYPRRRHAAYLGAQHRPGPRRAAAGFGAASNRPVDAWPSAAIGRWSR